MNKIILTIIFIILSGLIFAQQSNELTFEIGGGISKLKCNSTMGKTKPSFGGDVGLGFSHLFNKAVAIGFGAEISLYNSQFYVSEKNTILNQKDINNEEYQLNTALINYCEKEQVTIANIPFYVKIMFGKKHQFYIQPGVLVGFPLKAKYTVENAEIQNSAYYPASNNTIYEPNSAGLGNFKNYSTENTMELKNVVFSAMLDFGMKWNINKNFVLYTGIYGSLGLNDILPEYSQNFFIPNPSDQSKFSTNSIIVSQYELDKPFVSKANLLSAGIKIKIGFRFEKKIQITKEQTKNKNQKTENNKTQNNQNTSEQNLEKRAIELFQKYLAEIERRKKEQEQQQQQIQEQEQKVYSYNYIEQRKKDLATLNGFTLYGFQFKEAQLSYSQQTELLKIVSIMQKYPELKILCSGHTDERGSDRKNNEVGFERARIVKEFLVLNGIEQYRVMILSKAQTEPLYPNTNDINRALNRRVVINIIEQ